MILPTLEGQRHSVSSSLSGFSPNIGDLAREIVSWSDFNAMTSRSPLR